MVTLLLAVVSGAALAGAPDTFFVGEGEALLSYGALERAGAVRGRTGRILVGGGDVATIEAVPGIAAVTILPGGVLRVTPVDGADDLALSRRLHALAGVRWAHPDLVLPVRAAAAPTDPYFAEQWHLSNTGQGGRTPGVDINAPLAWTRATGAGQLIAILDSGVQLDHPDLLVVAGHDYVEGDDDPSPDGTDTSFHGTSVTGIAAARGNNGVGVSGVAPEAEVYGIRLIGGNTTMEDLYDAFVESVDAGAAVLSNSWGFTSECEPVANYSVFDDMVSYAEQQGRGGLGSVVVFAAGNGACDIEDDALLNHRKVLVVAAIEWTDTRAWYSSFGDAVGIAAPTTLLTTDIVKGGYGSYNGDDGYIDWFGGTSAATPVVAGVLALMFEANPRLTAGGARRAICDTAVRNDAANAGYDEAGWSPYYGCGRIDAGAAVAAVANTEPAAPVPTLVSATTWEGRAILAWEPAVDPDHDVYTYEVTWRRDGEGEDAAASSWVVGTSLDLGESLVAEDLVWWKVRAWDPWGAGPWSEETGFEVQALPEEPEAPEPTGTPDPVEPALCQHANAPPGLAVVALALAVVRRRRRG